MARWLIFENMSLQGRFAFGDPFEDAQTIHLKPETRNLQPTTQNLELETRNPAAVGADAASAAALAQVAMQMPMALKRNCARS